MEERKLEEYIRTDEGKIYKVLRDDKQQHYTYVYEENSFWHIPFKKIIKHSPNIIDLIEAGDYVNGILVTGKEGTLLYTEIKGIDNSGYHIPISQYGENIKSIVTKEIFNNIKYEV